MRVVAAFVGWDGGDAPFEIHPTLEAGAAAAAGVTVADAARARAGAGLDEHRRPLDGALLGLYSGGSLAHEAVTILEPLLGPLAGNVGHGPTEAKPGGHATA